MTAALATDRLTKQFDTSMAVDAVDWEVSEGSICALVGANGAGKSTLLKMLIGLIWPTGGKVEILGHPLGREAAEIRQRVHYVSGDAAPTPSFRVPDLVRYASLVYERFDRARFRRLQQVLELPLQRPVRTLSTGQKAQISLAIALSSRPDLMILDEPTNGLDPVVKRQFLQLMVQEAASEGTTVVLATHQLDDVERIADAIAVMYRGRMVASGNIDALRGDLHRFQAALPHGLPPALADHPQVLRVDRQGVVFTITAQGDVEEFAKGLHRAGAAFVEEIDLELSDWFRWIMDKEGYRRDGLLFS